MSAGWKLVSLRLSKPVANSIWGTEQLPKLPMAELEEVEVATAAAEVAVAAAVSVASPLAVTVTVT